MCACSFSFYFVHVYESTGFMHIFNNLHSSFSCREILCPEFNVSTCIHVFTQLNSNQHEIGCHFHFTCVSDHFLMPGVNKVNAL